MRFLIKLNPAKTRTLFVLALVLSAWWLLIPWISLAIGDLSNWLLSTAALSGPYRFADKQLFDLLENIYRAWWDFGPEFFLILTVAQIVAVASLSFCLLRALYNRWKAGTAKLWQLLTPMILLILAVVFTTVVLYMSYAEVCSWNGTPEQVDAMDDVAAPVDVLTAEPFS